MSICIRFHHNNKAEIKIHRAYVFEMALKILWLLKQIGPRGTNHDREFCYTTIRSIIVLFWRHQLQTMRLEFRGKIVNSFAFFSRDILIPWKINKIIPTPEHMTNTKNKLCASFWWKVRVINIRPLKQRRHFGYPNCELGSLKEALEQLIKES